MLETIINFILTNPTLGLVAALAFLVAVVKGKSAELAKLKGEIAQQKDNAALVELDQKIKEAGAKREEATNDFLDVHK